MTISFGLVPFVRNPDFREPVAQSIARKPQQSRRLALIAVSAPQRLLDHLVFPLLQGHARGQETSFAIA